LGIGLNIWYKSNSHLPNPINPDIFVYRCASRNNLNDWRYAAVIVNQCLLPKNDNYTYQNTQINNSTVNLPVLNNDIICNPNYTLSLLSSSVGGVTLSVENNNLIRCVLPSPTYTGTITFTYRVTINGNGITANVILNITN
jgi:hypothetical protein